MIYIDVNKNPLFNPHLDIGSILPVYYLPIVYKDIENQQSEIIGILQIVLKTRFISDGEIPEELEMMSRKFCEIVEACSKVLYREKII